MIETKFRGMTEDGKWIYGYYGIKGAGTESEEHYIITSTLDIYAEYTYPFYFTDNKVIKETIGQFTGLHDKNGVEIYEGDIAIGRRGGSPYVFEVKWDEKDARFLGYTSTGHICYVGQEPSVEVIGNIHENPELLKHDNKEVTHE